MIKLSNERIEQILHEETVKKEEQTTILRSIYLRYMRLYEEYFADIFALNDAKISEMRKYHEETKSLVKYYYMDIPEDVCTGINEFDKNASAHLLGPGWRESLFEVFDYFKEKNEDKYKNEKRIKEEFTEQALAVFYDEMDKIFREGFNTGSQQSKNVISGIASLLFGYSEKEKK